MHAPHGHAAHAPERRQHRGRRQVWPQAAQQGHLVLAHQPGRQGRCAQQGLLLLAGAIGHRPTLAGQQVQVQHGIVGAQHGLGVVQLGPQAPQLVGGRVTAGAVHAVWVPVPAHHLFGAPAQGFARHVALFFPEQPLGPAGQLEHQGGGQGVQEPHPSGAVTVHAVAPGQGAQQREHIAVVGGEAEVGIGSVKKVAGHHDLRFAPATFDLGAGGHQLQAQHRRRALFTLGQVQQVQRQLGPSAAGGRALAGALELGHRVGEQPLLGFGAPGLNALALNGLCCPLFLRCQFLGFLGFLLRSQACRLVITAEMVRIRAEAQIRRLEHQGHSVLALHRHGAAALAHPGAHLVVGQQMKLNVQLVGRASAALHCA